MSLVACAYISDVLGGKFSIVLVEVLGELLVLMNRYLGVKWVYCV